MAGQTFLGDDWKYNNSAENEDWASNGLKTFRNYIIDSTKITGLVVVYKGEIIFKYGDIVENRYIASCRKMYLPCPNYVEDKTIDLDKTIENLALMM